MRNIHALVTLGCAAALALLGCKDKEAKADVDGAAKQVERTFQKAPEAQDALAAAKAATAAATAAPTGADINAQRAKFIEALRPMYAAMSQGRLTPEQTRAMQNLFNQLNKAIQQNPNLMNKDLYEAQNAMAQALYRAKGDL